MKNNIIIIIASILRNYHPGCQLDSYNEERLEN